jgi:hypothetical protein
MALSSPAERFAGYHPSITAHRSGVAADVRAAPREMTLEEAINKQPTLMEIVVFAARTHDRRYIEEAKTEAQKRGRLPGLFASIVLFNAEK